MSIRISDPLFLLSAQTGLSVGELVAKAAAGNPDMEKAQEALKTGEPIPLLFCRRRNGNGGVMVQPKVTEAYFSNSIVEVDLSTDGGSTVTSQPIERVEVKYLLVLSEGDMVQIQVRDLFHGNCRRGTFNQVYDGRAGAWNPGNDMDDFYDFTASLDPSGYYSFNIQTLTNGQSVKYPNGTVSYYRNTDGTLFSVKVKEFGFPVFCGTSGSYSGLTTLSFEYDFDDANSEAISKTINAFIRSGLKVTRLVDGVTGESDNFVDLVKYLFQKNNRLADDLIDNTALTTAAKFVDANGFLFNGELKESQNLLDWLQATSVNFLLRVSNSGGKFGLMPRLPYNTDHTIKTTQVTPEFTFTEEHVVDGGFEIEYISLEDREPVCFVVQWRQQPEADFGLVRTVEVRTTGEAADGPFVNIDLSDYCTNEDHAVKVGAFRLAQRKFITHHLRLTVRERSYNASLVVGDIVRVRLRRETNKGEVEHHDKLYEINRVEKTFSSTIVYDLTHFPIDSEGRSLVARVVASASGAGNTINVGRSTFDCDENSSTDTSSIGSSSGGGGSNQPPAGDTGLEIPLPLDADGSTQSADAPFPGGESNPEDPIDSDISPASTSLTRPTNTGYLGNPALYGDEISFTPGCPNARIEWYLKDNATGATELVSSGVAETFIVGQTAESFGKSVYGVGCCPDPSAPGGYSQCTKSEEIVLGNDGTEGCIQVSGGTGTLGFMSNGVPSPFFYPGDTFYNNSRLTVKILHTEVFYSTFSGKWYSRAWIRMDTDCDGVDDVTTDTGVRGGPFSSEEDAKALKWTILTGRTDAYAGGCSPTTAACATHYYQSDFTGFGALEVTGGFADVAFDDGNVALGTRKWAENASDIEYFIAAYATSIINTRIYYNTSLSKWTNEIIFEATPNGTGTIETRTLSSAIRNLTSTEEEARNFKWTLFPNDLGGTLSTVVRTR